MRILLALVIFALGVPVTTPALFAFSWQFVSLSSEQTDDLRDPGQSENETDVADSDNEGSTTSATQTNDQ